MNLFVTLMPERENPRSLEAEAIDDALDLFALMATRLISAARRKSTGERLASGWRCCPSWRRPPSCCHRRAGSWWEQLDLVAEVNADPDVAALWTASKEQVLAALESVEELVPEDDGAAEAALRAALIDA